MKGSTIEVIKGDTGSLDCSSFDYSMPYPKVLFPVERPLHEAYLACYQLGQRIGCCKEWRSASLSPAV